MDCTYTQLSYGETGYFSKIVSDYIDGDSKLLPFYQHLPDIEGLKKAIENRKSFNTNRALLVSELQDQYSSMPPAQRVQENVELLANNNTFTICTAHQPAIFTGNLFFVYKILHVIKLAAYLEQQLPGNKFVPVFYMGSEDADLDELGHIYMDGEKIGWDTKQRGAIGRMKTSGLDKIINRVEGELLVQPHGAELMKLMRRCYLECADIQTATLQLVHHLFAEYGLIVLIPDRAGFKKQMIEVFKDELINHRSSAVVEKTIARLSEHYKVQAHPREINLFYLKDDLRQRIEKSGDEWKVVDTELSFSKEQLFNELEKHPERFSPNVILRGLLQETVLPNIAFVGGGGEIAYWLELKDVFGLYKVPYPVLVIRNSFLVIEQKWKDKMDKLRLSINDIFRDEQELMNELVRKQSDKQLSLTDEIGDVNAYYDKLKSVAGQVDDTLTIHVAALQTRAVKPLQELEKKLIRAEKRKFEIESRQLAAIKKALFPNNNLQERVDNFMPYYAKWGKSFIDHLYHHSPALDHRFTVLTCK